MGRARESGGNDEEEEEEEGTNNEVRSVNPVTAGVQGHLEGVRGEGQCNE